MIMPFSITNFTVICFYSSNRIGLSNKLSLSSLRV